MRILLIEEEKNEARRIKYLLKQEGYLVDIAYTPQSGADLAKGNLYQCLLLSADFKADLGKRLLGNIRKSGIQTPVLVFGHQLNGKQMEAYFQKGADDFLASPFQSEMLILRLKVVLRRCGKPAPYYRLGDIEFLPEMRIVRSAQGEEVLTKREVELLELLVINRHQVLPKVMIEERMWANVEDLNENLIQVHMSNLRKKLRGITETLTIETIRNAGYSLRIDEDSLVASLAMVGQ